VGREGVEESSRQYYVDIQGIGGCDVICGCSLSKRTSGHSLIAISYKISPLPQSFSISSPLLLTEQNRRVGGNSSMVRCTHNCPYVSWIHLAPSLLNPPRHLHWAHDTRVLSFKQVLSKHGVNHTYCAGGNAKACRFQTLIVITQSIGEIEDGD
jgi:hypothetical protein